MIEMEKIKEKLKKLGWKQVEDYYLENFDDCLFQTWNLSETTTSGEYSYYSPSENILSAVWIKYHINLTKKTAEFIVWPDGENSGYYPYEDDSFEDILEAALKGELFVPLPQKVEDYFHPIVKSDNRIRDNWTNLVQCIKDYSNSLNQGCWKGDYYISTQENSQGAVIVYCPITQKFANEIEAISIIDTDEAVRIMEKFIDEDDYEYEEIWDEVASHTEVEIWENKDTFPDTEPELEEIYFAYSVFESVVGKELMSELYNDSDESWMTMISVDKTVYAVYGDGALTCSIPLLAVRVAG